MVSLDVIPAKAEIQSSYSTLGPGRSLPRNGWVRGRGDHRCVTQLRYASLDNCDSIPCPRRNAV